MSSHKESHGDYFQDHFNCVYEQEDKVDLGWVRTHKIYLVIHGQKETVDDNNDQDQSVKPWINGHKLDDLVSEWVGHRQAAEWHCRVVLLSGLVVVCLDVSSWVIRQRNLNGLHRFVAKLSKRETCDVLNLLHLLLQPLPIKLFTLLWVWKVVLELLLIYRVWIESLHIALMIVVLFDSHFVHVSIFFSYCTVHLRRWIRLDLHG